MAPNVETASELTLGSGSLTIVLVVGLVGLGSLAVGTFFRAQVLRYPTGTPNMVQIARAVQEGAAAYLSRQFRTLAVFVVLVFLLLFLLPGRRRGRCGSGAASSSSSGALFSATIGYIGMWLAVQANVRVAAAAREGDRDAGIPDRVPHRRRRRHVHGRPRPARRRRRRAASTGRRARPCWRASASAPRCSRCSCGSAAASSPRPPTSAPTSSARSSRASPRTTRATPRPSPTTSATTSATAPAWRPTCSSRYAVTLVAALILGKAAFGEQGLVFPLIVPAIGVLTAVIGIFVTRVRARARTA